MEGSIYKELIDLVLQEVKDISKEVNEKFSQLSEKSSSNEKTLNNIQRELNDRLSKLEMLLLGVSGTNGMRGNFNKVNAVIEDILPKITEMYNEINNPNHGILVVMERNFSKTSDNKKEIQKLKDFKLKLLTIVMVIQIVGGILFTLAIKFNFFGLITK